tara:strand:+ start:1676 stop:1915 length:240 start_codon:yes stop_codon:yes gene_type:complete
MVDSELQLTDVEKQVVRFLVKSLAYLVNHKDMNDTKLHAMIDVFINQMQHNFKVQRHITVTERADLNNKIQSVIDRLRE